MCGHDIIGEAFKLKLAKIRAFLVRPTHKGGILLVTGQRGVGKTRLVDEALNDASAEDGHIVKQASQMFGGIGRRRRYRLERQPRGLDRVLLKVDIDPSFPHVNEDSEQTVNLVAVNLIRNIVCGLTSVIDSRYSVRRHGKTLRERLGFRGYWIDRAILWPSGCAMASVWLAVGLAVLLLAQSAIFLAFRPERPKLAFFQTFGMPEVLFFSVDFLAVVLAWVALRWLDWRALARMSEQLYDLVHAKEYQQDHDKTSERQHDTRLNFSLVLSLLLLVGLLCVLNPNTMGYFSKLFGTEDKAWSSLLALLPILLPWLILLSLVVAWTRKATHKNHAHFDQTNPAWMVNLLRRYLFLCHRCGLEPVLVLDELDKLEELDEFHGQQEGKAKETVNWMRPKPKPKDRLVLFLTALARLKASLGAEFLWILIGGPLIYGHLQKHRHERDDGNLGLLATVIHQELVLGPVGLFDAQKYMVWQYVKRKLHTRSAISRKKAWPIIKYVWLRTHGNFSTLSREVETMAEETHLRDYPITRLSLLLAKTVHELWEPDAIAEVLDLKGQIEFRDKVQEEWVIAWIRSGMLHMANRFIKDPPTYEYFDKELGNAVKKARLQREPKRAEVPEITAILTGDPQLLRQVGESLLYKRLKRKNVVVPPNTVQGAQPEIRFRNLGL